MGPRKEWVLTVDSGDNAPVYEDRVEKLDFWQWAKIRLVKVGSQFRFSLSYRSYIGVAPVIESRENAEIGKLITRTCPVDDFQFGKFVHWKEEDEEEKEA